MCHFQLNWFIIENCVNYIDPNGSLSVTQAFIVSPTYGIYLDKCLNNFEPCEEHPLFDES